jgi:tRNA-specific 2-thiouridylase
VKISGNDGLFSEAMILENINWVSSEPREEADGIITIRYNHKGIGCKIHAVEQNRLIVEFNEPQRAVTPGQSAALYKNDRLILGGIIQKSIEKIAR